MAKVRFDFRKELRALAARVQDENLARLLTGQTVSGGAVAPHKVPAEPVLKGRAKRVRLHGIRVSLRELAGRIGVRTGAMLKDITRRANAKIGRVSFKIVPSPEVRRRWFAFVAGTKKQVARPVSGIDGPTLSDARDRIARSGRDQIVAAMQRRRRG